MAQPISGARLLELLNGSEEDRQAVLNPVSNTESFIKTLSSGANNMAKNTVNLLGNLAMSADERINPIDDVVASYKKNVANDKPQDSIWGSIKQELDNPFQASKQLFNNPFAKTQNDEGVSGAIGKVFNATNQLAEQERKTYDDMNARNAKVGQYSSGGLGNFAAEMVLSAPTMAIGSLRVTNAAIKAGANGSQVAKAIGQDAFRNSQLMGTSEFALAKFKGDTDEEAIAAAIFGKVAGGLGTPLVAGAKIGHQAVKDNGGYAQTLGDAKDKVKDVFNPLTEAEMAKMAGGGRPEDYGINPNDVTTKSGRTFEAEDRAESKKKVEDIEFKVSSPVAERAPIEGNIDVPSTNNDIKFKQGFDDRGRNYTEESSKLSYQGTADQKATLGITEKPEITNPKTEVDRRMKFYDNDSKLRSAYGTTEASFKNKIESTGSREAISRLNYEKDQYASIMKDKALDKSIRNEARTRLQELNKIKIENTKISDDIKAKAELDFQKSNLIDKSKGESARDIDLREEYKVYKENNRDKEGYVKEHTKSIEEATSNVFKKAKGARADVIKAIQSIKLKEKMKGKGFSENNITKDIRSKYPDEATKIENFQARREDLALLKSKSILGDEFRYREKQRIDKEVSSETHDFKDRQELEDYKQSIIDRYDAIGIYTDPKKLDADLSHRKASDYSEDPIKKDARESKELEDSLYSHNYMLKEIDRYRKTGVNNRKKTGAGRGKKILNDSQIEDIEQGILTDAEIANKTSPHSIKADRKDKISEARASASKKVNASIAKSLGIKGRFKNPVLINFKDLVIDASNSVAQISTVLLGSRRLADLSKVSGKAVDMRAEIATIMQKAGFKNASKDSVKPLFMKENYGQMNDGLVKGVMKAQGLNKVDAQAFVDGYFKASDALVPEMNQLAKVVFDLYKSQGKSTYSWTLPDGFKVEFNLNSKAKGEMNVHGNTIEYNVKVDNYNEFARALMPNLIHSVDGYVAARMNKEGFPTVHDAYVIPKGREAEANELYKTIMQEINSSDLLHDMMKEMGYKGKSIKTGDLTNDVIAKSDNMLSTEHSPLKPEMSKERKMDVSRQGTPESVMRDYMASGNYRQAPTNGLIDSMVNEAGYNNSYMKVARDGDDVYERQIALAMQDGKYNKAKAIEAPEGVDKRTWDVVQYNIFHEARAKLEYNPLLRQAIQGERRFFDEVGNPIGAHSKTVKQLINDELRIARKILKNKTKQERKILGSTQSAMKKAREMESNPEHVYTFNDIKIKEFADEVVRESHDNMLTKSFGKDHDAGVSSPYETLWNEQVVNSKSMDEFNTLEATANRMNRSTDKTIEILYNKVKAMPKEVKDKINVLFDSDYQSIRGMKKAEADALVVKHKQLLNMIHREVNATANGLGNQSEQFGAYMPNARAIADRYNLPHTYDGIIDKLISIQAMKNNKGWEALEQLNKSADLDYVMDVLSTERKLSRDRLFTNNPEKMAKGYKAEVYRGNKKIENGKVMYNADSQYENGVLGAEKESNKVGKAIDPNTLVPLPDKSDLNAYFKELNSTFDYTKLKDSDIKVFEDLKKKYDGGNVTPKQISYYEALLLKGRNVVGKTLGEELDFMTKHRLRKTNNEYRVVSNEEIKVKAGKVNNLEDTLSETMRSTLSKINERNLIGNALRLEAKGSTLFSSKPKNGMTELSEEQLQKLPYEARESIKFVNTKLLEKLIGRDEVRIYNGDKQMFKMADRLVANLGTMFKQNVVLKNPVSYINASLVNQTIGLTAGISPANLYRHQAKALKELKEMNEIVEKLSNLKLTGKKLDKALMDRLHNNYLWQMERKGLSTNRVEGVVGDDDLIGSILKDNVYSHIYNAGRHLNLNQSTPVGKATLKAFSTIDTLGRYTIAMDAIEKGMPIDEAVKKANGLYGDMDKMVPKAVELLDKYQFVPFLKWFTLTSPMLIKTMRDNPARTLAVGAAIYLLAQETNTNLSTVNPLEGMLDFAEGALPLGTMENISKFGLVDTASRRANSTILPKYLDNMKSNPMNIVYKLRKERIGKPYYKDSVDFRGITQQIIEGD